MKKMIRKIIITLRPNTVDHYVYTYDVNIPVPDIKPRIEIDLNIKEEMTFRGKKIIFIASHKGKFVNRTELVFSCLMSNQLGYKGVPVIANGETVLEFRGKNVMAFMFASIMTYYAKKKEQPTIYMYTDIDNVAIHRVMDKIGCVWQYRVRIKRVLSFCRHKEYINVK